MSSFARPSACDGTSWYAVFTQPTRELRAKRHLDFQGFETFLPRRLKTIRHARKLMTVNAAFFPRYLFVKMDIRFDRWRSVNGTFGVTGIVMRGQQPHPIPHGVIERLLAVTDEQGFLRTDDGLAVGRKVRLMAGPFAERMGILERMDNSARVRVLLNIIGGHVPVSIERQYVAAA